MDKLNDLRLILALMMRDEKNCKTLGESSDNMEKYIPQIIKFCNLHGVVGRSEQLPCKHKNAAVTKEGWKCCDCGELVG